MERQELIVAAVLALVSLLLGFGLYSIFFHPIRGELRSRYKGGRQRLALWIKTRGKWVLLALVLIAVAAGLVYAGVRYGGAILEPRIFIM